MSENVAEQSNLFPNPLFTPDGRRAWSSGDCELTYNGGGVLTMSPLAGVNRGGWCDFVVPVQPGDYVASVDYRFADGANDFRGPMLIVQPTNDKDWGWSPSLAELDKTYTPGRRVLRFTVPGGVSYVRLRFQGSKSRDVKFCEPLVELASTYDGTGTGGGQTPPAGGHSGGTPGTGTGGGQTPPAGGHSGGTPGTGTGGGQTPPAGGHSGGTPGTGTGGGQTPPAGGHSGGTPGTGTGGGQTPPAGGHSGGTPGTGTGGGQTPPAGGHSGGTPGTGTGGGGGGSTTAPQEIYNLCSNPRILAEHCKPTNCIIGMTTGNDALRVTATNNSSNAFVELPPIDVSKLNGVTLRCRVETTGSGTVSLPAICYMKFPDDGQLARPNGHLKGTSWKQTTIIWDFIVPNGEKTMIPVITAPANSSTPVYWARMLISTRADAQTLASVDKSQNLNYFDGSTRPE